MKGVITEIQRFSLNDGPGIRTTVFLKGCNMRCEWCHNPETIRGSKEVLYYENNCIGCFKCVAACPSKAHKRSDSVHHFYPRLCVQCGKCVDLCYAGAMVMSGSQMTVEEVMAQVLQDKAYYEDSKGGVTISGGEVLCQTSFATELVEACHREGISVAVETNLYGDFEAIRPFLEKVDHIMCDLKLWDASAHQQRTGVSNETIKENISKLHTLGIPFIVRTPLIPGVTDSVENVGQIAAFLSRVQGLTHYELLNYNPLGDPKYKGLGKANPFREARPLPAAAMEELRQVGESYGILVKTEG